MKKLKAKKIVNATWWCSQENYFEEDTRILKTWIQDTEDNITKDNSCHAMASKIGTFEQTYLFSGLSSISVLSHVNIRIPSTHSIKTYKKKLVIITETS